MPLRHSDNDALLFQELLERTGLEQKHLTPVTKMNGNVCQAELATSELSGVVDKKNSWVRGHSSYRVTDKQPSARVSSFHRCHSIKQPSFCSAFGLDPVVKISESRDSNCIKNNQSFFLWRVQPDYVPCANESTTNAQT